jgi:3-oxo-5alpha-steroid 4-dehydrogenase
MKASIPYSDEAWDYEADVVVVGFGGAGVCAALEAKEAGADVLAIDSFEGGGATSLSGGVIYAGATPYQREADAVDSIEDMFNYLKAELGGAVSDELLKQYCAESAEHLAWLARHGVQFSGAVYLDKTDYPPTGKFLYYSGNEVRDDFARIAKPAPRGHRAVAEGLSGGVFYVALKRSAQNLGVRFKPHTPAKRLLRDPDGRIIGVEAVQISPSLIELRKDLQARCLPRSLSPSRARAAYRVAHEMEERTDNRRIRIMARKGVILATGGYTLNEKMVSRCNLDLAPYFSKFTKLASIGCDGSGIELGESAGGATRNMSNVMLAITINPLSLRKGILVNRLGKRFVPEDGYNGLIGAAVLRQPGGKAWMILDRNQFWRSVRDCLFCPKGTFFYFHLPPLLRMLIGGTRVASSIESLARKLGCPAGELQATLADYNGAAGEDRPDPLAKGQKNRGRIVRAPFFAVDFSLGKRITFAGLFTLGGLAVEEGTQRVLDGDGQPLPGLYAVGRAASGLCAKSYVSGMSIGDCVFTGRLAGRHAAAPNSPAVELEARSIWL